MASTLLREVQAGEERLNDEEELSGEVEEIGRAHV